MSALAPVTPGERLDQLDILRGFALFGILLVNFEYFLNPIQSVVLGHTGGLQTPADAVDLGIKILAEGKFYPLFAMLFGAGFALMYERAVERGQGFWSVYLRRLLILLVFGLVHLLLIWSGDILLVYALVAFVMVLLFRRTPASRLPKWAVVFLLVPTLAIVALAGLVAMVPPSAAGELQQEFAAELVSTRETVAQAAAIYANGSFVEASSQRLEDLPFLLWQENMIIPTPSLALASVCLAVGAPLLAFGYLAVIVVNRHRLTWLAPAGRMALTNYLMQSLFWTWIIYGYGLGLGPRIPPVLTPVLVAAFFALQVLISHLCMDRFRFGPAEWLWRRLTYLRAQPMRKAPG